MHSRWSVHIAHRRSSSLCNFGVLNTAITSYCGDCDSSSGKYLLVVVSKVRHIRVTMGALERLNLALKILTGRHVPTRSEIESLKSSLRVARQMSAKEIASAVIHQELSRHRELKTVGAKGRR